MRLSIRRSKRNSLSFFANNPGFEVRRYLKWTTKSKTPVHHRNKLIKKPCQLPTGQFKRLNTFLAKELKNRIAPVNSSDTSILNTQHRKCYSKQPTHNVGRTASSMEVSVIGLTCDLAVVDPLVC